MYAWLEHHRSKLARRALLLCRTAAFAARRQRRVLSALEAHTVRRRIGLQQRHDAMLFAARGRWRRGLTAWAAASLVWGERAVLRRRASMQHEYSLVRACWGGLARYHLRQQHKAAQLRQAAEMYQRRLERLGATSWLAYGLERHQVRDERGLPCNSLQQSLRRGLVM